MFFWYPGVALVLEAAKVIERRLEMIATGKCPADELLLMVSEKLDAEATAILVRGGHPDPVIDSYRKIVAANAARLTLR